jgi:hypothetical protein
MRLWVERASLALPGRDDFGTILVRKVLTVFLLLELVVSIDSVLDIGGLALMASAIAEDIDGDGALELSLSEVAVRPVILSMNLLNLPPIRGGAATSVSSTTLVASAKSGRAARFPLNAAPDLKRLAISAALIAMVGSSSSSESISLLLRQSASAAARVNFGGEVNTGGFPGR